MFRKKPKPSEHKDQDSFTNKVAVKTVKVAAKGLLFTANNAPKVTAKLTIGGAKRLVKYAGNKLSKEEAKQDAAIPATKSSFP